MRKRLLKLALLPAVVAVFAGLLGAGRNGPGEAQAAGERAVATQILRSTVQIDLVSRPWVEDDVQHRLGAQGLGTLLQAGAQRFILTHDHWSLLGDALSHVVLRDARGAQLLVLDGATFLSLVRYRDGGALLVEAPLGLSGVSPAALHDGAGPAAGDTVWLPVRAGDGLGLSEARVEAVHDAAVPGTLQLHATTDAVAAGDSGAGVWLKGRLIANLWAVTEVRTVTAEAPWPWHNGPGGDHAWQRTGFILAGLQPLRGASGLITDDLAPGVAADAGYERGPHK